MFSASAISIGCTLAETIARRPWISPQGSAETSTIKYIPQSLFRFIHNTEYSCKPFCLFSSLKNILADEFSKAWAHIFIGAAGIAVRAIAPFIVHKSKDPPVIVIDSKGRYVINLLSGHWGGGNNLAIFLAEILNAHPILTTASDIEGEHKSLDLIIQNSGLSILDWPKLPSFQGRFLRGETLYIYDPCAFLKEKSSFQSVAKDDFKKTPLIIIDWKKSVDCPEILRLVPPVFSLGFGFRKGVTAEELLRAFNFLCADLDILPESVGICATIAQKAEDPEAQKFANLLNIKLKALPALYLTTVKTPNPSSACGKRFSQSPFSVCESSAIIAAKQLASKKTGFPEIICRASLYTEKKIYSKKIAMALAVPNIFLQRMSS